MTNSPVGTYTITNSIGNLVATNYAVSLTNGLLTINPVGLTLTASNQAKVYGQTLSFAGTEFGASGLLNGDSVSSASLSSVGSAAVASVAGSPYSIVITNAVGTGLTNYTISYVNGLLTVNAAVLGVSANNTNRAYGATNPVFTVSYNGFVNGDGLNVLSGAPALTTSASDEQSCGQLHDHEQHRELVATNYAVSLTNGLLTVNPVGLTLTASNQAKVYGQTLSFAGTEFGASGLLNGDSVSSASLSSVGSAAVASVAGSPYSIVITNAVGNGLTNYTISYVNGLLTVNAAVLGVSANNTNRAYGATNPVFTVSYNGFVNGDGLNVLSGAPASDDECHDEQSCGHVHDNEQHRQSGGDELRGESDERFADGQSGGIDADGEQPGEGVRADAEFCGDGVWGERIVERGQCEQREFEQCGIGGGGVGGRIAVQHRDNERGGDWADELHDQLRERAIDGERGGIGSEREQHEPCVRSDQPGVHGKLQRFCERGRSERAERGAHPDNQCDHQQSCGQLT